MSVMNNYILERLMNNLMKQLSRRDILKTAAIGAGAIAFPDSSAAAGTASNQTAESWRN